MKQTIHAPGPDVLETFYIDRFQELRSQLGAGVATVDEKREPAIRALARIGFPDRKHEQWRYTDVRKMLRNRFDPVAERGGRSIDVSTIDALLPSGLDAHLLVFVDGFFEESLSRIGPLPGGVVVTHLGRVRGRAEFEPILAKHFGAYADVESEAFVALNTAFATDGAFVYVPRGASLDRPVHVLHLADSAAGRLLHPRHLFVIEAEGSATLLESYHSNGAMAALSNVVTELFVGERGRVEHLRLQAEHESSSQICQTNGYQQESSYLSTVTITLNGRLVRNNVHLVPNAEHCETHLAGLYVMNGDQHVDNHTFVDHAKPGCFSNELYKGILDDRATSSFSGMLLVRPDAQQTNAFQENKTILLSDDAASYAKPQLEIYADDVKCSHGATTGEVDQEALFYLRARGIGEEQARNMLLYAFVNDVLEHVTLTPVRDQVLDVLALRLG